MVARSWRPEADARCRKADEWGQDGKPESEEATTTKDEEIDAEFGTTASEGREVKHALRPVEGQETSMHSDEREQVTGNGGPVEPLRGEHAARCQDWRMVDEGEGCCAENNGVHTGKRKCGGFPEGMQGHVGQKGVSRGKVVMRASKDTDIEVGMMVCSTAREHDKQRKGGKCVMGSSKDRSTSTHSEDNTDVQAKPTEGKRGAGRVGTPRCAARKRRIQRIYEVDKDRATGSSTAFGRTE